MRKGYKRRRGLVALLSAFVLVLILSVPMFAVDSSGTAEWVTISGTLYFKSSVVLSGIVTDPGTFEGLSGSFEIRGQDTSLLYGDQTAFIIGIPDDESNYYLFSTPDDGNMMKANSSTYSGASFAPVYNRYVVFNNFAVEKDSVLYDLILGVADITSSLTISNSAYMSESIVDVIVGGFNGVISGLGSGVADFFQTLFIANDGSGNLSTFAIVSLVFIGVAVAFGIARWIIKKVGQ